MLLADKKSPAQRILVVDDEPFVCESVKMMLTHDAISRAWFSGIESRT